MLLTLGWLAMAAVLALFLPPHERAYAVARTWDGGGATTNWSDCANWLTNVCPASGDTVTFDATSTKDVVIDASATASINTMNINAGYTGTVSFGRSFSIPTFSQAAGTFTVGVFDFSTTTFTLTGGTFNAPGAGDSWTVNGNFTVSGSPTFNANGGIVTFASNAGTISCNNVTFNQVVINKSGAVTIQSDCTLPLGASPTLTYSAAGATLTLNGTITGSGDLTISGSTGTIAINATADWTGFRTVSVVPNLTVNATGNLKIPGNPSPTLGIYVAPTRPHHRVHRRDHDPGQQQAEPRRERAAGALL